MSLGIVQHIRQSLCRHKTYCVEVQVGRFKLFRYLQEAVTQKVCFRRPVFLTVVFHCIISQIHVLQVCPCIFQSSYTAYIQYSLQRVFAVNTCLSIHTQNTYHLYRLCTHMSIPMYTFQNYILQYSLYEIPHYFTVCACSTARNDTSI